MTSKNAGGNFFSKHAQCDGRILFQVAHFQRINGFGAYPFEYAA
jgi:hypothetical protein